MRAKLCDHCGQPMDKHSDDGGDHPVHPWDNRYQSESSDTVHARCLDDYCDRLNDGGHPSLSAAERNPSMCGR